MKYQIDDNKNVQRTDITLVVCESWGNRNLETWNRETIKFEETDNMRMDNVTPDRETCFIVRVANLIVAS